MTYKKMDSYIQEFPKQIEDALQIGANATLNAPIVPKNIVVTGLGGSGIGAELVANYIFRYATVPFYVNKDYLLPTYVDNETLVIVCSYSGNTEETINAMQEAYRWGARIVCITSGGEIAGFSQQQGIDCMLLPGGYPPRACMAYSFIQILYVLLHYGIIDNSFEQMLLDTAGQLRTQAESIQSEAQALAEQLHTHLPIIYADQHISAVATRWRQQLNENSKILAWERVIPEMNHNEMVGWRGNQEDMAVIFLKTGLEFPRSVKRFEINKQILAKHTPHIFEVTAKGTHFLEKALYLIHFGDWLSWYLAELRGVDAVEVKVIDYLKSELAK